MSDKEPRMRNEGNPIRTLKFVYHFLKAADAAWEQNFDCRLKAWIFSFALDICLQNDVTHTNQHSSCVLGILGLFHFFSSIIWLEKFGLSKLQSWKPARFPTSMCTRWGSILVRYNMMKMMYIFSNTPSNASLPSNHSRSQSFGASQRKSWRSIFFHVLRQF